MKQEEWEVNKLNMEANKNRKCRLRKWLQNEEVNIGNLWKREQALQLIGLNGVEILDNRDGGTGAGGGGDREDARLPYPPILADQDTLSQLEGGRLYPLCFYSCLPPIFLDLAPSMDKVEGLDGIKVRR